MRVFTALLTASALVLPLAFSLAAATRSAPLTVTVEGVESGRLIPEKFAFCAPDEAAKTRDGGNISPAIRWEKGPEGTKSYAIIMVDPDVPARFDDANQEGKTLPADMARQDFYHWVLIDIPANVTEIAEGAESAGVVKTGKAPGKQPHGVRGLNDYGTFMKGKFAGYDGPCPPWNDERLHRYRFAVYALDVPSLRLSGNFNGAKAMAAMRGHILAKGEVTGTYTQNPAVKAEKAD